MTISPRNRILDDATAAVLRGLDVAQVDDGVVMGSAAQGALSRILEADHATRPESPQEPGRRHTGRWVTAGVAVLAGGLVAAVNLDRDSPSRAYASWTATPSSALQEHTGAVAGACRRSVRESLETGVGGRLRTMLGRTDEPTVADVARARVVLAETRGDWTLVSIAGRGIDMTCLSRGADDTRIDMAGGSLGIGDGETHLAVNAVMSGGPGVGSTPEGSYSYITGSIGRDVTGVTVILADGRRVVATVSGDRFAAWWPGAPLLGPDGTSDVVATGGERVTLDLTLRDGTVRRGIPGSTITGDPEAGAVVSEQARNADRSEQARNADRPGRAVAP